MILSFVFVVINYGRHLRTWNSVGGVKTVVIYQGKVRG